MSATIEGSKEKRFEVFGWELPELSAFEVLHEVWRELGQSGTNGMGLAPFTWQELESYKRLCLPQMTRLEALCLMDMSRAYVQNFNDRNPFSISPLEREA